MSSIITAGRLRIPEIYSQDKQKMASCVRASSEGTCMCGEEDVRMGKTRSQIDSGAIDTVGPKKIAKAFEMQENCMSRKG